MNIGSKIGNPQFRQPWWRWPVLAPLALAYRLGVACRGAGFRLGWLRVQRAACPVIAVGNLTVGGSGKTPMVDFLLQLAGQAGIRCAVISRGHGRGCGEAVVRVRAGEGWPPDAAVLGDEPALLARRHPGVPVYVCRSRARAARLAAAWDAPELLVLDDAYQHRGLARDLNLLLIDAENGLGNGRLLPFGPLREPASALGRADAVLLTKAAPGRADEVGAAWRGRVPPGVPVFVCGYVARRIAALEGGRAWEAQALDGREVSLVCGIADPEGFSRTVRALGGRVGELRAFGDHHAYGAAELARLDAALGEAAGAPAGGESPPRWLTTEKDAVKLRGRLRHGAELGVLEMALRPEPAGRAFFFLISSRKAG